VIGRNPRPHEWAQARAAVLAAENASFRGHRKLASFQVAHGSYDTDLTPFGTDFRFGQFGENTNAGRDLTGETDAQAARIPGGSFQILPADHA
jgi:hypothetical protein